MNEVYFNYLSEIVRDIDPLFRISPTNKTKKEIEKEIRESEKKIKQMTKNKQLFLGNGIGTFYVTINTSQYGDFNKNRCVMKRWEGEIIEPNIIISHIAGAPEAATYLGISVSELERRGISHRTKRILTPYGRKDMPVFSLDELNKYKKRIKVA